MMMRSALCAKRMADRGRVLHAVPRLQPYGLALCHTRPVSRSRGWEVDPMRRELAHVTCRRCIEVLESRFPQAVDAREGEAPLSDGRGSDSGVLP